jgi:transcriptional regulator with XRE-family HTH domain
MNLLIGPVLAEARRAGGIEQKTLAHLIGISPGYLCDIERGARALYKERIRMLPEPILGPVTEAFIAAHAAEIEEAKAWLRCAS